MSKIVKLALLIGINYTGTDNALNGCINDATNLQNFLVKNRYFKSKEIIIMNDNASSKYKPTKKNILAQFANLVKFANNNKKKTVKLFVSYSGHGSNMIDKNGDEADGMDEVLCPIDFAKAGFITDDEVKIIIDSLPSNVKLFMLIDACHSGTMCDLKFNHNCDDKRICNIIGVSKPTSCDVIMISGCLDEQTSADAYLKNPETKKYQYQGAITSAFIANYKPNITYYDLINNIRKWLRDNGFDQFPQLSSGKLIEVDEVNMLNGF